LLALGFEVRVRPALATEVLFLAVETHRDRPLVLGQPDIREHRTPHIIDAVSLHLLQSLVEFPERVHLRTNRGDSPYDPILPRPRGAIQVHVGPYPFPNIDRLPDIVLTLLESEDIDFVHLAIAGIAITGREFLEARHTVV